MAVVARLDRARWASVPHRTRTPRGRGCVRGYASGRWHPHSPTRARSHTHVQTRSAPRVRRRSSRHCLGSAVAAGPNL